MTLAFEATRDGIIRTDSWSDAKTFYQSVLGLPIVHQNHHLVGFSYLCRAGHLPRPGVRISRCQRRIRETMAALRRLHPAGGRRLDPALLAPRSVWARIQYPTRTAGRYRYRLLALRRRIPMIHHQVRCIATLCSGPPWTHCAALSLLRASPGHTLS